MSINVSPGPLGVELGYAEITANHVQTGAGSADVAGLSVTANVGGRPIIVRLNASSVFNSSASGISTLKILEGSTQLASVTATLTTTTIPVAREVRLSPSAGSHTYKVSLTQVITGNSTLSASATDPASLQVVEV